MTAISRANLYLSKGTDFSVPLELSGLPEDFDANDYTFVMKAGKLYSPAPKIEGTITIDDNDTITLAITKTDTENIASGKYVYDVIMIKNSDDTTEKILEGLLFLDETIATIY